MPSKEISSTATTSMYFSAMPLKPAAKTSAALILEKAVAPSFDSRIGAQAAANDNTSPHATANHFR